MTREVAVVGFAHAPHVRRTAGTTNGVEMLMPCFAQLYSELGISQRTAEHHRQSIMRKMGVKSLAMLVQKVGLAGRTV